MFELNQHIYKHSDDSKSFIPIGDAPIEKLANTIVIKCKEHDINNVHLYGDEYFLQPIVEEIKARAIDNYDFDTITVEVN